MTPRMKVGAAGMVLIVATNAIAVGGALYNRSGAPESQLALSERELSPPYSWEWHEENSGLSLHLIWRTAGRVHDDLDDFNPYGRNADWLDAAKLQALGFDVSMRPDDAQASEHYDRQLDHEALLVLELDGSARAAALQAAQQRLSRAQVEAAKVADSKLAKERLESAQKSLLREQGQNSRLFVVDAGPELRPLREKYPDAARYAIVRGHVGISVCERKEQSRLCGRVEGLEVSTVNVPLDQRPAFEGAKPMGYERDENHVRYAAVVAFGRRLEPWLVSAQRAK
jgi:hypothetical protein